MSVTDRLSIQLYTLRTLEDLDLILDTVADAGYRYVETVGSHLDKAGEVRTSGSRRAMPGESMTLHVDPTQVSLFAADSGERL